MESLSPRWEPAFWSSPVEGGKAKYGAHTHAWPLTRSPTLVPWPVEARARIFPNTSLQEAMTKHRPSDGWHP